MTGTKCKFFSSQKSTMVCTRKEWLEESQPRACCTKSLPGEGSQRGPCELLIHRAFAVGLPTSAFAAPVAFLSCCGLCWSASCLHWVKSPKRATPTFPGMMVESTLAAEIQVLDLHISAEGKVQNQSEVILFIAYSNSGTQGYRGFLER